MRIFLAGASGAIGRRLLPLLLDAGHQVTGTTRHPETAMMLERAGVVPTVVDVFDAPALTAAVGAAQPAVVIHQLTDLPRELDGARIAASASGNARIRSEGTRNLVAAAQAAGADRFIVQSISFAYAPGGEVVIGAADPGSGGPLEIWVRDNGAGIPAERIDKVFDALETDPKRDGVGLGLAIVKTFVEAHDGNVAVESVVGHGSTFRFTLPRTPAVKTAGSAPATTGPLARA